MGSGNGVCVNAGGQGSTGGISRDEGVGDLDDSVTARPVDGATLLAGVGNTGGSGDRGAGDGSTPGD